MGIDYFKNLESLLLQEKADDEAQHTAVIENSSVSERRAEGICWYPVAIRGTENQRADYLSVELERTTHQNVVHSFRVGSPVFFFSNHNAKQDRIAATVTFQSSSRIRILIKQDELPEWSSDGKLGLDLAFDNNSYAEMFKALKSAPNYSNTEILTGQIPAEFNILEGSFTAESLNNSQNSAVKNIISAQHLSIIHGPPGTGKTTTLIVAISELLKNGAKKILVTAPSNTAVDLLAEKLSEKNLNVLRIGNPARVSENLNSLTLEYKMARHASHKEIKKLRMQANEYRNMAHKYKRNFGRAEREQRKALFDEAHKILKEIEQTESYIIDNVLNEAQIVAATLVGSSSYLIEKVTFDVTVIDEVGQSLEPACWIPIQKSGKLVLAGDHFQLPPTIKSKKAEKEGLGITLLEKLVNKQPEAVAMLETQYRMNAKISAFSSNWFYRNKLSAHRSVKDALLNIRVGPFLFIDTAGSGYEEKLEGTSVSNSEEAALLIRLADEFLKDVPRSTIGIISPYRHQLKYLQEYTESSEVLKNHKVSVNTIDSFQGQERDAIFISMTRSNPEGEIGFLKDIRRMNVAMTRAKKLLVIVGDSATIGNSDFYSALISYAQENHFYRSVWEYMEA